jgi:hypothetical protein
MILRLVLGAGLVALAYYIGREVGRTELVREELRKARAASAPAAAEASPKNTRPKKS